MHAESPPLIDSLERVAFFDKVKRYSQTSTSFKGTFEPTQQQIKNAAMKVAFHCRCADSLRPSICTKTHRTVEFDQSGHGVVLTA